MDDNGFGDDADFYGISVDEAALKHRKFSMVQAVKIAPQLRIELGGAGLLTQKREREELARRQRLRQQNMMSVQPAKDRRKGSRSMATQSKSVNATGTSVDLPGHYILKELHEPAPQMQRINHTVVRYDGMLYMFGGRTGSTPAAQYVQDLHHFVPARQQWVPAGEEQDGKGMGAAASKALRSKRAKDRAGVSSGVDGGGDGAGGVSQHPGRRGDHSAVVIGHDMYVFGGRRQQVPLDDLFAYNFLDEEWRMIDNERQTGPGPTFAHAACYSDETKRMYLIGGVHQRHRDALIYSWDTRFKYWRRWPGPSEVDPNEFHRCHCVARENHVYVYGLRNSHQEHTIYSMHEATGVWTELTTLGHPNGSLGVLWNVLPPVYFAEVGIWGFFCSAKPASTPAPQHLHPVNATTADTGGGGDKGLKDDASSNSLSPLAMSPTGRRRSSVGTPGGSGAPSFRRRQSSVSARSFSVVIDGSTPDADATSNDATSTPTRRGRPSGVSMTVPAQGPGASALPSVITSTRVPPSVIAGLPAAQRDAAVWLMAYQFSTGVWTKITLHGAQSGPRSGALFSKLLIPNCCSFEKKYAAVPFGNDGSGTGLLITGGTCEEDRLLLKLLPRKGLPASMSTFTAAKTVSTTNLSAGDGRGATKTRNDSRVVFSPSVSANSKRDTTGEAAKKRKESLGVSLRVPSLEGGSLAVSRASSSEPQSPGSPRSPSSGSLRRSRSGISAAGGGSRSMSIATVGGAVSRTGALMAAAKGAEPAGPPVAVVPFGAMWRVPHALADPSGCPVACLSEQQMRDWERDYYASECAWLATQKTDMDAAEAAAQKQMRRAKARAARDRQLASVVYRVKSGSDLASGADGGFRESVGIAASNETTASTVQKPPGAPGETSVLTQGTGRTNHASMRPAAMTALSASEPSTPMVVPPGFGDGSDSPARRPPSSPGPSPARSGPVGQRDTGTAGPGEGTPKARKLLQGLGPRMRAAYQRMAVPLFQQKDIALSTEQRQDPRFRTYLRWELLRRYVKSGGAARDAAIEHSKAVAAGARGQRAAHAAADGGQMTPAEPEVSPFAAIDELLWPTSAADQRATKMHNKRSRKSKVVAEADDPDMEAVRHGARVATAMSSTLQPGRRNARDTDTAGQTGRRIGSIGAVRPSRNGSPRVHQPKPPANSARVAPRMTVRSVLQGDAVTDSRLSSTVVSRAVEMSAPVPPSTNTARAANEGPRARVL